MLLISLQAVIDFSMCIFYTGPPLIRKTERVVKCVLYVVTLNI